MVNSQPVLKPRASVRDVAALAGVSRATVTNVFKGRGAPTSEETRERVLAAARALSYVPVAQPSYQSRNIATHTLGVAFDDVHAASNALYSATYEGVRESAGEHGYDLLTITARKTVVDGRNPTQTLEARFLDRRCDGYVIIGPYKRPDVLNSVVERGMPLVVCYSTDVPNGGLAVVPDNRAVVRATLDHLMKQGHRRISHLAGPPAHSDASERRKYFEAAALQFGLESTVRAGKDDYGWADLPDMRALLADGPTAVFCVNDHQALLLWHVARELGLRVPEDLSIVGVDNTGKSGEAGLTTCAFSPIEVGRLAIDGLVGLLRGEAVREPVKVVPVEIISRSSVARASLPAGATGADARVLL